VTPNLVFADTLYIIVLGAGCFRAPPGGVARPAGAAQLPRIAECGDELVERECPVRVPRAATRSTGTPSRRLAPDRHPDRRQRDGQARFGVPPSVWTFDAEAKDGTNQVSAKGYDT
jgi:hypothetical protein